MSRTLLEVHGLHAHYGSSHVLQGIDVEVREHECVTIFGRNGVGKTTLIHSIMGLVKPSAGSVVIAGANLAGCRAEQVARSGVALVPQGRRIFPNLSVEENLLVAERPGPWDLEKVYGLLPRLKERRRQGGGQLSGGEQQMLAVGRALMGNPRLLLLDEPSEGLAPLIVDEISELLLQMKGEGLSVLLVEQNIGLGTTAADRVLLMDAGRVLHELSCDQFRQRADLAHEVLGVSLRPR